MDSFMMPSGSEIFPFSQSSSGLPAQYRDQLLKSVMPSLTDSINNMPGNIDSFYKNSMSSYGQDLMNALQTNIPRTVSNLANRGILNSSVASKSIQGTTDAAMKDYANKGYQAALQAALLKSQTPNLLGNMLQYGSSSSSYSEDKTALYQTLAQMLMAQM